MTTVLVTGSEGFIGKNVVDALRQLRGLQIRQYDRTSTMDQLKSCLQEADVVIHLAGANRPQDPKEFDLVNVGLTREICSYLTSLGRTPKLLYSSSIQAALANPYGMSKKGGEDELIRLSEVTGAEVVICRLQNVFGKWCRPFYNSVIATFCHSIARDLPITIDDPEHCLDLVYIDDVVQTLVREALASNPIPGWRYLSVSPSYQITLGAVAERIQSFRASRSTGVIPDFSDRLNRCLYATFLSNLPDTDFAYSLGVKADQRGELAEFVKSSAAGQIFVSRTKPGATRGNHYHHTKTEKFLVLEGNAVVRFRHVLTDEVIAYPVSGSEFRVVDIPPGFTHSIENVGQTVLVVLFWASEIFDPDSPDTYFCEV